MESLRDRYAALRVPFVVRPHSPRYARVREGRPRWGCAPRAQIQPADRRTRAAAAPSVLVRSCVLTLHLKGGETTTREGAGWPFALVVSSAPGRWSAREPTPKGETRDVTQEQAGVSTRGALTKRILRMLNRIPMPTDKQSIAGMMDTELERTDAQRAVENPANPLPLLDWHVGWVLSDLKKTGFLSQPRHGLWELTGKGRKGEWETPGRAQGNQESTGECTGRERRRAGKGKHPEDNGNDRGGSRGRINLGITGPAQATRDSARAVRRTGDGAAETTGVRGNRTHRRSR